MIGLYNKIAQTITQKLISNNIVKKDDFEIYQYGFELLLSLLFTVLVVFVISFFIGMTIETMIYFVGFFSVRVICGGYHAKHHWSCFITTLCTYLIFLFVYFMLVEEMRMKTILFVFSIISVIIILFFAPVEDPNNHMSEFRRKKSNILKFVLSFIVLSIFTLACLIKNNVIILIAPFFVGIFIAAFAILVAKVENIFLKERRNTNEKNH